MPRKAISPGGKGQNREQTERTTPVSKRERGTGRPSKSAKLEKRRAPAKGRD
jgi:hypothetical protein